MLTVGQTTTRRTPLLITNTTPTTCLIYIQLVLTYTISNLLSPSSALLRYTHTFHLELIFITIYIYLTHTTPITCLLIISLVINLHSFILILILILIITQLINPSRHTHHLLHNYIYIYNYILTLLLLFFRNAHLSIHPTYLT